MRIRLGDEAGVFGPQVRAPNLSPAEEKALLRGETIDRGGSGLADKSFFERGVRNGQAAEIGDALTLLELAISVQTGFDFVGPKLIDDALAASLKVFEVRGRPPILQVAMTIEFRALVVEAVSHFMADDRAYAAVVDGVISVEIEEGGLEDPSGEYDFVQGRIVVGVDGRRSHVPFVTVNGLADLGDVARKLERIATKDIFHIGTAVNFIG